MGFMRTKSGERVPFVFYTNAISFDQRTRDLVKYHKIASPHLGYERYVLEQIYNEKLWALTSKVITHFPLQEKLCL